MDKIGKYKVLRTLGNGASSEVYLGVDPFLDRQVAIKLVRPEILKDEKLGKIYRKLFMTEASLAGKLQHPHIAEIYDAVEEDEFNYIVMEYVDGGTLEQFCVAGSLLPVERAMEMVFKCSRALDYAHEQGVTHRDIKPENILFAGGTDVKISDFGAALTGSGEMTHVSDIGSPAYMSPQQIKGHPLDHRTDIFSLGVVLYKLLTGQLPFQGSNNHSIMYQITSIEPALPSSFRHEIPPSIDAIVKRAMEKDIDERYQHWKEFSFDLAEAFRSQFMRNRDQELADSQKFNTLRKLSFFRNFSDVELWEVVRISTWKQVKPDEPVVREGEVGDAFFVLASGEVKVTKSTKLLNVLGPGDCFGEMAYLSETENVRGADVIAMTDADVITISTEALRRASDNCRHQFDRAFLRILIERLALANTRLVHA
jgi:eukaryotic-like serine/threonine-protein kinase